MSENSDVEKTEEPTPQRKEKARDDGQVLRSRELSSFLMMLSGGAFFGSEEIISLINYGLY